MSARIYLLLYCGKKLFILWLKLTVFVNGTSVKMPELPEVETIKTAVEKGIGQARIEEVIVRNGSLRLKVPTDLPQKITGAVITRYRRIAKYIIIELNNNQSLIWHMGMSGKVKLCDEMPENFEKHDHIIIRTSNGVIIYNDPRRFGVLTYCATDKLSTSPLLAHCGIDPFDKKLTAEYLFGQMQKRKKTPVKQILLNQEIVAGIGNIYASEILYEARISPLRPAANIGLEECKTLVTCIRKVLQKAITAGGSTLRDYKKPDGSLGYFQNMHCVYNKTGQRCPDCICDIAQTGGIKKTVLGGRSTFYCERLQK